MSVLSKQRLRDGIREAICNFVRNVLVYLVNYQTRHLLTAIYMFNEDAVSFSRST